MPFSKCSNLEANKVTHFKLCNQRDKSRTMISDKQNLKNKAFQMGLKHLKIKIKVDFKLETKLTKTKIQKSVLHKLCKNFSASKRRLRSRLGLSGRHNRNLKQIIAIECTKTVIFQLLRPLDISKLEKRELIQ